MFRGAILSALATVAVFAATASAWHEDPDNDLVKNVYFTDKLNSWSANQNVGLSLETTGRFRYRMHCVSKQASSTPGVKQTISVIPGQRYRLRARGYVHGDAKAFLWARVSGAKANLVWSPNSEGFSKGRATTLHADFLVPAGAKKIDVGVLLSRKGIRQGDKFTLEWVSVRRFDSNWLANNDFNGGSAAGWKNLGAAQISSFHKHGVRVTARAASNGAATRPVGIVQNNVGVESGRRYRIKYAGARVKTSALVVPRVYRSADNGVIAGPDSMAKASYALPMGNSKRNSYDFTVPEGVDRVNIAIVFYSSGSLPAFKNGDNFVLDDVSLYVLPNLIDNGELDNGVLPWIANGHATVAASVDAGDRSLTATVQKAISTPGIRIDKVPVVPGTRYHFEATGRTVSKGSAFLWVQEPHGEDLHWVYRDGFSPASRAAPHAADFVAPRGVEWVNLGVLFSRHPKPFRTGDRIIMHSAMLTGGPTVIGRPPTPPVRPVPPPPPPPKVIPAPLPAKAQEPPPWVAILGKAQSATLLDNVQEPIENVYKSHPQCKQDQFKFLSKFKPHEIDDCSEECESKFYNKGTAGDPKPYTNYRVCFDCCADLLDQYDGLAATGTAGYSWKPVSAKMLDSEAKINFNMKYLADEDGKLSIEGVSPAQSGCGKGPGSGFILYIKGPWTKIQYTEHFWGSASCNGVFGSNAYHYLGDLRNGLLPFSSRSGDKIYDAHRMSSVRSHEFDGRTTRCDNKSDNWWHTINGKGERRATVNLRRDPKATRAGVSTGVSCASYAKFKITDMYVWAP